MYLSNTDLLEDYVSLVKAVEFRHESLSEEKQAEVALKIQQNRILQERNCLLDLAIKSFREAVIAGESTLNPNPVEDLAISLRKIASSLS